MLFVLSNSERNSFCFCSIVSFGDTCNANFWKIEFSDNGLGFEQQYEHKIFELFQRLHGKTEYEGTGIGLAICKKIVQSHNGTITAKGQLGVGATFTIYLPENIKI